MVFVQIIFDFQMSYFQYVYQDPEKRKRFDLKGMFFFVRITDSVSLLFASLIVDDASFFLVSTSIGFVLGVFRCGVC